MPKTYMDLKKSQYNEIDENVYEKIKTELPMENRNVYEQFLADILLNDIGSVKIETREMTILIDLKKILQ